MNKQEIFNRVWDHFVINKSEVSYFEYRYLGPYLTWESDIDSAYRSPSGARCSIGLFIADDDYHEDLEGRSIWEFEVQSVLPKDLFGDLLNAEDQRFLWEIQRCHDNVVTNVVASGDGLNSEFITLKIKENLLALAKEYKLKLPEA